MDEAREAPCQREVILEAVGFTAEQFLRTSPWERCIQAVLARLGQAAGVSRVYVFAKQRGSNGRTLGNYLYEWVAPGIKPQIDDPFLHKTDVKAAGLSRWTEVLDQGEAIYGRVREFPEKEKEILLARGLRSIAVAPIFVGSQRWGGIGFDECLTEREWSKMEIEALKATAGIIGAAIRRQQVEEEGRRQQELATLNGIIAAVSSTRELKEAYAILKDLLTEKMDAPGGVLFTYDAAAGLFRIETDWGLSPEILDRLGQLYTKGSPYGRTVLEGRAVLYSDLREITSLRLGKRPTRAGESHWQYMLCVPLLAQDEVIGALALFSRAPTVLTENRVAFYKVLGQGIGLAIHNARLYQEVRARHEELQALSYRLVEMQEAERRRIARVLHDEIAQLVTALKLSLDLAARAPAKKARALCNETQTLLNKLLTQVRNLSLDLRPAMLDDLGLLPALLWHIERYSSQTQVRVHFRHAGLERRFPPEVETTAYRIAQESLANAARHANVNEVTMRVWADEEALHIQIEDQGAGFAPENGAHASGGLAGIRERAHLLGGQLTVESAPGMGTRVTAEIPLYAGYGGET